MHKSPIIKQFIIEIEDKISDEYLIYTKSLFSTLEERLNRDNLIENDKTRILNLLNISESVKSILNEVEKYLLDSQDNNLRKTPFFDGILYIFKNWLTEKEENI